MQILHHRRALHQIPELEQQLPKTAAYLMDALAPLRCRVFQPMESAVCAFFDNGAERTIAFRADMDGLPVAEKTGAAYASRHPGVMHACGHDGHMAILLELASRLDKKKLDRNILLVFQPGEESPGGAKDLCGTGVLEEYGVDVIFGLHLWPGLCKGGVFSRPGGMMSRSSEVTVTVTGKSAHIGKADLANDALAAGVRFYTEAVEMERAMDPDIYRLLKFGRMESGRVRNVISDTTRLEGSLRTFDDDVFAAMGQKLYDIAARTAADTGCAVDIHMSDGYPAICNPEDLFRKVSALTPVRLLPEPSIISEDFSWYQRYVPGMFFFLGVGDTPALHTDTFDFDETVLLTGADLFETLAEHCR